MFGSSQGFCGDRQKQGPRSRLRGPFRAQKLAGEEGFEPSIPCSRDRCLTVRPLASGAGRNPSRKRWTGGRSPGPTGSGACDLSGDGTRGPSNVSSTAAAGCDMVARRHWIGAKHKRHTTLPLLGFGEKVR